MTVILYGTPSAWEGRELHGGQILANRGREASKPRAGRLMTSSSALMLRHYRV